MKGYPILFNASMVRALLDGSKTQTRRIVRAQPAVEASLAFVLPQPNASGSCAHWHKQDERGICTHEHTAHCPYGMPGDRLWVRETWQHSNFPSGPYDVDCDVFYRADYMSDPHGPNGELSPEGKYRTWRPSIHMPRDCSRITLEIVSVRVERLQDISESDAAAEGVKGIPRSRDLFPTDDFRYPFKMLWESINGAGSWDANPWVWCIEFKQVTA